MSELSRILIIGGGISGLTLGQSLLKASIPFTIFERDPSASFRAQGYRLGHNQTGDENLRRALPEELYRNIRAMGAGEEDRVAGGQGAGGGGVKVNALTGEIMGAGPLGGVPGTFKMGLTNKDMDTQPSAGREITGTAPAAADASAPPKRVRAFTSDRAVLRSMLGLNLEGHIEYGKRFTHFTTPLPTTTRQGSAAAVTAHFEDGSQASGGLLIGADGIRSKVYSGLLASLHQPPSIQLDLEMRGIYGKTILTPEFQALFPEGWRTGMSLFIDPSKKLKILFMDPVIFTNRAESLTGGQVKTPEAYLYWALSTTTQDLDMPDSEFMALNSEQLSGVLSKLTEGWDPTVRLLIQHADTSQIAPLRLLSAPPHIPERPSHPNVTIMGDAVHPMSPTGGAGANTAIRDAALLGELLQQAWDATSQSFPAGSIAKVVEEYEAQMRVYASEVIAGSFRAGKMMGVGKDPEDYQVYRD